MPRRVSTPKHPLRRIFLREWREYRGNMTQETLVARMKERVDNISVASISRLENAKQPYTQQVLEVAAWALNCEPEDIIIRNPLKEDAVWSIVDHLRAADPSDRATILKMTSNLAKRAG